LKLLKENTWRCIGRIKLHCIHIPQFLNPFISCRAAGSFPKSGIHWETPLNIDFGINNERQDCKVGTVFVCRERYLWVGVNERRWWRNRVDRLHIHKGNRMMKPLENISSGTGREVAEGDRGGELTVVQCKTIKKC
jgi:hypothetical protein